MRLLFGVLTVSLLVAESGFAANQNWPQWRGPGKNSEVSPEAGIDWSKLSAAKKLWETPVGIGYSSLSVVDGRAYTMGHDGEGKETLYCLNAETGKELWSVSYAAKLLPAMHVGGPNATPTVADGDVYTLSKDGQAFCFDAATGKQKWAANVEQILGIKTPTWGYASSPVVLGDRLIVGAGRVVALDRKTGKKVWASSEAYHAGYATPVVFRNGPDTLLTAFDGKGLSLLHAGTGAEAARHPFKTQYNMTATDPIVSAEGDRIFISAISQGELLSFDGTKLSSIWSSKTMRNSMNVCLERDGYLYGVDGKHKSSRSKFSCVRLSDGKEIWSKENFGYATLIVIGDTMLVLTEEGDLVAVAVSQDGYRELGRKKVLDSICWTPPSIVGKHVFVRNDNGRAQCYELQ